MSEADGLGSLWQRLRRFLAGAEPPQMPQADPARPEPAPSVPEAADSAPPAPDLHDLLLQLFVRLRRAGFELGVPELMAAYQALDGGWGADDLDELAVVAKLIWCNARPEEAEFDLHWARLAPSFARREAQPPAPPPDEELPAHSTPSAPPERPPRQMPEPQPPAQAAAAALRALPVRATYEPAPVDGDVTVQTHWPLPRRNMRYMWRYLRRPVADGPADVLDVRATVHRAACQGYYLAPVYRRRVRNHARLVLLIDQGGSMAPLHRFTRDVAETVLADSTLEQAEIYYFHNVPGDAYFADPHLTVRVPAAQVLDGCDGETSVLIVSDVGAARGERYLPRIQATARFLAELKAHTTLIAWLNPLPRGRWSGSSAQYVNAMVDMLPMDPDGLAGAIDVLRGQN